MGEAEVLMETRGAAGVLTLNRPKALNALTLNMVRMIDAALDTWMSDPNIARIVVRGAGERAFCAGGDIRLLYEQGRAGDHAAQLTFWREEYLLNRRIARLAKPYVALLDGIVMGGGVGMSIHGSHVLAGDRTVFAMPEVGIGFFPDVGATYALPRLPHHAGTYLAMTGAQAKVGDVVRLGLADHYVPSVRFEDLTRALESGEDTQAIVARFAAEPPASPLLDSTESMSRGFAGGDLGAVREALRTQAHLGDEFAARALEAMAKKSPTSQAIAARQMRDGAAMDFETAMITEFRIVSRICRGRDFYEGVRAVIVDKDNAPVWDAAPDAAPDVDAYFAPLGADELIFPESSA